ncbi:MAG: hypothetical protein ACYTEX_25815 [Planctomycetota bacterium]|jgi:hypothetical protein
MRYRLRFHTRYDEDNWNRTTYEDDRNEFYKELLSSLGLEQGIIDDATIEIVGGTREIADAIIRFTEEKGIKYMIGTFVEYYPSEIKNSRFVPFLATSNVVDYDRRHEELNKYDKILCDRCGTPDESTAPDPFYIGKKAMRRRQDFYYASGGFTILSTKAMAELEGDIAPWISYGPATVIDKGQLVDQGQGYFWIKPKYKVGYYTDARIKRMCPACKRPTEIRKVRSKDIFMANMHIVESFKGVNAPIALIGNWFGEIARGEHFDRHQEVIISGSLHERIKSLELKGFSEADYVIHADDEPYDWEPSGNGSSSPEIIGQGE